MRCCLYEQFGNELGSVWKAIMLELRIEAFRNNDDLPSARKSCRLAAACLRVSSIGVSSLRSWTA
jgi:hypothetical protein